MHSPRLAVCAVIPSRMLRYRYPAEAGI
jgi:hypothetical protein